MSIELLTKVIAEKKFTLYINMNENLDPWDKKAQKEPDSKGWHGVAGL